MNRTQPKNIASGNEYISLPEIRGSDAGIESFTFLHMGLKGMIMVRGCESTPLFRPAIYNEEGEELALQSIQWERDAFWIPRFHARLADEGGSLRGTILAPVHERGFAIHLEFSPGRDTRRRAAALGIYGRAAAAFHRVNETKILGRGLSCNPSAWNGAFTVDLVSDLPVFSFAPMPEPGMEVHFSNDEDGGVEYSLKVPIEATGDYVTSATFWWGVGFEEVGAVTAAKELFRKGWDRLLSDTRIWLEARSRSLGDAELDRTLNMNLFFNFFYASGLTLDTEEFVLLTSRSPRYYVSASYWDRDSLLWSFPSILAVDPPRALEMLHYAYGRQIRNVGIHSRYIDGTVLEPGFELDELVAPLLALDTYVSAVSDTSLVLREPFASGVDRILSMLRTKHDAGTGLYETFLQPTDDPAGLPFLTYDNVLVWKALTRTSQHFRKAGQDGRATELEAMAAELRNAVFAHCIHTIERKSVFAWAVDGAGAYEHYDEPPGSLELLAWHGFVSSDDPVYLETVSRIRDPEYRYSFAGYPVDEIGCAHAPQPWILSLANSLLCGRTEKGKRILSMIPMDDGVACESVDERTGEVATGAAFATCAGFLAFAMLQAFGGKR